MTKREAFKVGFLAKLASAGLTPSELVGMLEKKALLEEAAAAVKGVAEPTKSISDLLSSGLYGLGIPLYAASFIGLPYLLGKATGGVHSELTDVTPDDIERMKLEDFTSTYKSEAEKIKRKLERDKWRAKLVQHAP